MYYVPVQAKMKVPSVQKGMLLRCILSFCQFTRKQFQSMLTKLLFLFRYGGMDLNGAARRKNATRETTNTLKAWLYEHRKNPYPTKGEKIMLAIITKMTLTQVSTWFANARRRLKKENKMTWSPRNRCGDDDDDVKSNDDEDNDNDDIKDLDKSSNDCEEKEKESKGKSKTNYIIYIYIIYMLSVLICFVCTISY